MGHRGFKDAELAVLEAMARNPGATISEVTRRTRLAQSLFARITRVMADAVVVTMTSDGRDPPDGPRRTRSQDRARTIQRAGDSISDAPATHTAALTPDGRVELEHHLGEAGPSLRMNADRTDRQKGLAPQDE
ncbi:hypothetical protein ART_0454 [Arthrobacter sp. PAMC 25486]|uniref:MarR family transcriptional regulator n=1 Tax=Arthrobacter sp. PAMC 25486 TaxID=1494608 RepID=UPI0005361092|nr:MarR family transcriptional regulator [Arthrobacter sp. PAMC 25486]AIY00053.1 hypothetical protein ART_0454 [Arthrobacter sp. PAMC 25486]